MAPRPTVAVCLLALCTACATPRAVRLDTGDGAPLEYRGPSARKPVAVSAEAFEDALARLLLESPLPLRPARQGWLVRASYPGDSVEVGAQPLVGKSFGGICKAGPRRPNCLSLLDDVMNRPAIASLSGWGRRWPASSSSR
jgi:hypothetical protein